MAEIESSCGICNAIVRPRQKAMECSLCKKWIHIKCANIRDEDYKKYQGITKFYWFCEKDEPLLKDFIVNQIVALKIEETLGKKIDELNENVKKLCDDSQKQMSFAQVVKNSFNQKADSGVQAARLKLDKTNGVIVKPKNSNGPQQNIVEVVKRSLDVAKGGAGVTSIKTINKGGCFLGTISKEDSVKVEKELTTKIGENYEIYKPAILQPQLILTGVEREYNQELLRDEIIKTNFGFTDENDIKIEHKREMKSSNDDKPKWLYILQAPENTFKKLYN